MGDVEIKKVKNIDPIRIQGVENGEPLHIEPLRIGQIAPAAVHIKELNHIDPISVESLRIDQIRNLDPVRVERFDVTHLPTVNISLSRLPSMDVNVRRIPPLAVTVQQEFCLPSQYTIHARLLGIEFLRFDIHGRTMITPKDRVAREQARSHERSFPDVAAAGNPGIPTRRTERVEAVARHLPCSPPSGPSCAHAEIDGTRHTRPAGFSGDSPEAGLSAGHPRFSYPVSGRVGDLGGSSVSSGGRP